MTHAIGAFLIAGGLITLVFGATEDTYARVGSTLIIAGMMYLVIASL